MSGPVLVRTPDQRKPKKAEIAPPAIQGGSLLALRDGRAVVVGDPDRHRILVVSLDDASATEVELPSGTQPGRAVEDTEGLVHVVLRGKGKLLTLQPESGEIVRQRRVCNEPRGLAYDPDADTLLLACADGMLWRYAAATGEELGQQFVYRDLRDVALAQGGVLWLSTFRTARVFRLDADGDLAVVEALEPPGHGQRATGAWRMVSDASGAAIVVHQHATEREIHIEAHDAAESEDDETLREPLEESASSNSYGGGLALGDELGPPAGCDSIVQSAVTAISSNGELTRIGPLGDAILPVDVAVSETGGSIAVVSAGARDPGAPKATVEFADDEGCVGCSIPPGIPDLPSSRSSVHILSRRESIGGGCTTGVSVQNLRAPAIAATFVPGSQRLIVLTRDPSRLYIVDAAGGHAEGLIELGGVAMTDTGHELFHRDAGGGIACASCHLEGAEDGHVWRFSGLGPRRTQPLNVRLRGTKPFHWDGEMDDLGLLMREVFVGRMGGAPQSQERVSALAEWMFDIDPPKPLRARDDPAAERGKALFESSKVGCKSCHSGKKLTNNQTVDVGTSDGVPLQVPSLLGVGYRSPLMHTGCAPTLVERFEPSCGGGDKHGKTSHLSPSEIDDLVAYLETL